MSCKTHLHLDNLFPQVNFASCLSYGTSESMYLGNCYLKWKKYVKDDGLEDEILNSFPGSLNQAVSYKSCMNYRALFAHTVLLNPLETQVNLVSPSKTPSHLCFVPVQREYACNQLQETPVGVHSTINRVCEKSLVTHSTEPPRCVMHVSVHCGKIGGNVRMPCTGFISSLWSIKF